MAVVMWCPIGFEYYTSCPLHCWGKGGGGGRERRKDRNFPDLTLSSDKIAIFATVVGNKVTKTVFTESTVDNNSDSTVQGHDGNVHSQLLCSDWMLLPSASFLLSFLSSLIF